MISLFEGENNRTKTIVVTLETDDLIFVVVVVLLEFPLKSSSFTAPETPGINLQR